MNPNRGYKSARKKEVGGHLTTEEEGDVTMETRCFPAGLEIGEGARSFREQGT